MSQFSLTFIVFLPIFGIQHAAYVLKFKRTFKLASAVIGTIDATTKQGSLMLIEVEKSYSGEVVRLYLKKVS